MELVNLKSKKSFGISLSLVEVTSTILIASLVKLIAAELSVFLILFFRYLFCIPLLFLTSFYQRKKDTFKIMSKSGLFVRTAAGLFSFGFLFAALKYIDLSLMTTLLNTIPLFVTLLAPILINERVGFFKILMALIGFMGVFLIINPSYELLKYNCTNIYFLIKCIKELANKDSRFSFFCSVNGENNTIGQYFDRLQRTLVDECPNAEYKISVYQYDSTNVPEHCNYTNEGWLFTPLIQVQQ